MSCQSYLPNTMRCAISDIVPILSPDPHRLPGHLAQPSHSPRTLNQIFDRSLTRFPYPSSHPATKSKQRSGILKLRRQIRESHSTPYLSTAPLSSALTSDIQTDYFPQPDADDGDGEGGADPLVDAEAEERWERIAGLVERMRVRGDEAVARGRPEVGVGVGRVLGWEEVDRSREERTPEPEPERGGGRDEMQG